VTRAAGRGPVPLLEGGDGSIPARRIHIVGGEATGKTTLALQIGALLETPVTALDTIAWRVEGSAAFEVWDPRYQPSAPIVLRAHEERVALVRELAVGDRWVTEGKHLWWTAELFDRADVIVWLDHVGPARAMMRIVRRAARSALREARHQRGLRKVARFRDYAVHGRELLGQLFRRVRYGVAREPGAESEDPGTITRADIDRVLRAHGDRVFHVRRDEDLARLVRGLEAGAGLRGPAPTQDQVDRIRA
jgi:hypothetical protein